MEEKNYKNNIENAAIADDFSLDDILDEFRTGAAPRHFGEENIADQSKRIVLDAFEENVPHPNTTECGNSPKPSNLARLSQPGTLL